MLGRVLTLDHLILNSRLVRPDRGIPAAGLAKLHERVERRIVADRVECRVGVQAAEIGVAIADRLPQQLEGTGGEPTPFLPVSRGHRPGGPGEGAGGVVAEVDVLGPLLDRVVQGS